MESRYDPKAVEERVRKFWDENRTFSFDENGGKKVFSIDTPPPTVSGDIHLGHIFSYSQAEFIARYKRMRGFNVFYPFGLDNNGLPTEILIEKKFDTTAEKLGRDKFVELVRKEIQEYNKLYIELWKRMGLSVDWSLAYQTISPDVQRVSQKSFLELNKMDRVYRKEAPALFCPKEGTTVSQMELKDKMIKSKIVYVKFSDDVEIATTRAELLPACVAILVNPDDAKHKHLVGKTVKIPIFGDEVKVIADKRVDPEFGTGVVMCCTFGDQTDIEWYKAYNLDLKMIIDEHGRMNHEYYKGLKIKEAREKIINDLKERCLVIKEEEIEHNVNVHERCGTEIEFLVKKQWYVKYLDLKSKFLELGREVRWYPEFMIVRYENWVKGLQWDWSISRQRFFGVYFPLWYCKKCNEPMFAAEKDLPVNPFVDKPHGKCSCGSSEFEPESDVMDTWATSSLTPFINARWGLDDKYVKKILPMDLRVQAHEIISFWAFNTIVKSYFHTGTIPWKSIMISGHGLDSSGKPMHKSAGNVVKPEPYIEKYGADALRFWASSSVLGEDNSFQEKEVVTGSRVINKLWNLARFVEMKCLDYGAASESKSALDNWILRRLDETVKRATDCFESYNYFNARTATEAFFWEFANDYLEFVKDRIYSDDKSAAYTVSRVFLSVLKMMAPFIPFVTEEIYQEIFVKNPKMRAIETGNRNSIHISEWPNRIKFNQEMAESGIVTAQAIVEIRKKKHEMGIALNEDISSATLYSKHKDTIGSGIEETKRAMKVKEIKFEGDSETGIVSSITR